MTIEFIPDFHLFDGEGGGDTASSSGSEQGVTKTVYGKGPEGNGQTSQVGTDNGREADDLNAEWKALTGKGGKFHDLYGQGVSEAIQGRFKNQSDKQAEIDAMNEGLTPLYMHYGLRAGDYEGLTQAIATDDELYKAGAEKAGLDVEQYKQNLRLQADSDRLHQIQDAYRQEQERQERFGQWEADAAQLQQAFPAFDLGMEIDTNEQFRNLLDNGVDVMTAFHVTHYDELNQGLNAYHQRTATQEVVNNIQQRAARPMEGALQHAPAIQRKSDPSSLSGKDLDEINRQLEEGEITSVRF